MITLRFADFLYAIREDGSYYAAGEPWQAIRERNEQDDCASLELSDHLFDLADGECVGF